MKIIKFTLSGLLAHFKTPYTNSSKLTYEIPSFTVIEGILGAILGFDKWDYHIKIERDNLKIGIKIEKPIQRIIITLNQCKLITPFMGGDKYGLIDERTQIPMEHIFNPEYSIYIHHSNSDIYKKLSEKIISRKSIYPLYFGSAYCLAEYIQMKEIEAEKRIFKEYIKVNSIIPVNNDIQINYLQEETKILREELPYRRNNDFTIQEYKRVVYNPEGKGLYCKGEFYQANKDELFYLFG